MHARTVLFNIIWSSFLIPFVCRGQGTNSSCNFFGNDHLSQFGKAQYIREHPPPYRFRFVNENNETVKRYKEGVYSINLFGRRYFRRIFIQAKLTTKYGYIMGNLANAEFIQDESTDDETKFTLLSCSSSQYNNTLINTDNEKKYSLNVKWTPKKNDGPVQFIVTIEREPNIYWYQWTPRGGLILPENNDQFAGVLSLTEEQTQKQSRFISNADSRTVAASSAEKHLNVGISAILRRRPTSNVKRTAADQELTINCTSCSDNEECQFDENGDEKCICKSGWTGEGCRAKDYCHRHRCKFGSACVNGDSNYTCQCNFGYGGRYCQFECPSNLCDNNGTCQIDKTNQYLCDCQPGWTGDKCDQLISELTLEKCSPNPCLNGAQCVNLGTLVACKCQPGYTGKLCHRPCQDVYGSCSLSWKGEDSCDSLRDLTKFFDTNCPVSCKQCEFDEKTVNINNPLPPLLESLLFILGVWVVDYNSSNSYPTNFDDSTTGYYEEINFSVPTVSMFGLPNINFMSKAVSKVDPDDVHTRVGFVHLAHHRNSVKVALITSGNDGLAVIEEGTLVKNELRLSEVYRFVNHELASSGKTIPNNLNRKLSLQDGFLVEKIDRYESDRSINSFVKKYQKIRSHVPY